MSIHSNIQTISPANLAEVITIIETDPALSGYTRRDLVSAINRTASMFECKPKDIHSNVQSLRQRFLLVHPASFNLTPKSLSNVKSNLARALVVARVTSPPAKPADRTDAWRDFLASAEEPHQAFGLGRFASWCSVREIEPADVADSTIKDFGSHLDFSLLTNDPWKVCQDTVLAFNLLNQSHKTGCNTLTPWR